MVTKIQDNKVKNTQSSANTVSKPIPNQSNKPIAKELQEPKSLSDLTQIYRSRPKDVAANMAYNENPSVFLSRFGLKTPDALDKFLRTPAGKEVIAEIAQELANQEAYREYNLFENSEHELLIRRIKIALFLWYLDNEAYADDKIKEWIREDIQKTLSHNKKDDTTHTTQSTVEQNNLQDAIKKYSQEIEHAKSQQASLQIRAEDLIAELALLDKYIEQLTAKYNLYEKYVEDEHFNQYMNDDGTMKIDAINRDSELLEQEMLELLKKTDDIISDDEVLTQFVEQQKALNSKLATLHDMRAVHEGSKYYVDNNGARVHSLQEAAFILSKEDKLIYENGQYYLLKPTQNWDSVKDNPEERIKAMQQAQENFNLSKSDIMTVKKVINHNRGLEQEAHNNRIEEKRMELGSNSAEQLLLENQIRLFQSIRAEAQKAFETLTDALKSSITPTASPKPTPTPINNTSNAPTPRPTPQRVLSYKQELEKLKQAKELTKTDLLALAAKAPGENQASAHLFIQNLFASGGSGLSRMTAPIRDQILNRMAQYGGSTPAIQQQQTTPTYKSPSPFDISMRPDPYKGG